MSAVPTNEKRERQSASQAPARHSDAGRNPPTSSFRTPRSGDPESSSLLNRTTTAETVSAQHGRGWLLVPIHSITHHRSGNSKLIKGKLSDKPNDNLYPAFSASGQDVWHTDYEQEGDAIVVSAVGARCGKCFLAGGKWSAIANTHVVWPDPEKVAIKFLWYLLNDEKFWIRSGTAQPFVAVRKTFEKEIHLPPLPVQREIVAEIEKQFTRLDAGVAALRRVQANLKRYRAAVLKAACEGRLVPTEAELAKAEGRTYETGEQLLARILADRRKHWHGRGKYKEPAAPDTTNLPPLPEGWAWASIEQLGDVQLGRQRSPKNISKDYPTKYIRAANITEHGIDLVDVLEMEFSPAERERFALQHGDIVLSEASGSSSQVGKPAIWRGELPLCCFQNTVLRLRPVVVAATYILVAFRHFYANGVFAKVAGGVGINHLSAAKFSAIPFPLPPLAEQTRIVAEIERCLSIVEELEVAVAANLQRATRLRQSILRRAFSEQ